MTKLPTYPALVDLISRLQEDGLASDASICVKVLYDLNRRDKRIAELEEELNTFKALEGKK